MAKISELPTTTSLTGAETVPLVQSGITKTSTLTVIKNWIVSTLTGYAASGANSDITSLSGLTTPLSVPQGGTGQATASGALTALGGAALTGASFTGGINEARGSIAMHATTMNLWGQPNIIDGTGVAVTITAITNAPQAGARRILYPITGTTITNGATFAVDGAANYTTASGDALEFEAVTTSTYKVHIIKADGTSIISSGGASIQGMFKNLQVSAAGTGANVSVSADEIAVENTSNAYATLRSVSLTINTAASGANGLDTGVLAGSTWYSVWVIYNGTTTAGLISTSATAPTMPGGYTHKARVGWIRTDGTANKYPLSFKQQGRSVQYVVASGSNVTAMPVLISGAQGSNTVPTWVAASVSQFVPPTAGRIGLVLSGTGQSCIAAPNNSYGAQGSSTNPPPLSVNTTSTSMAGWFVLESTNIYFANNGAGAALCCYGWEDNL